MRTDEKRPDIKSIGDALQILDDAAQRSSHDVQQLIQSDIIHLKETLEKVAPEIKNTLVQVKNKAARSVKEADHHVEENKWWYLGGTAAVAGTIGYLLSRKN